MHFLYMRYTGTGFSKQIVISVNLLQNNVLYSKSRENFFFKIKGAENQKYYILSNPGIS